MPFRKLARAIPLVFVFLFAPGVTVDRSAVLTQAAGVINSVAERALPAVVSIATIRDVDPDEEAMEMMGPGMAPFDLFEGPRKSEHSPKLAANLGSGVVIDKSGLILTNHHVVEKAERITVVFDEHHKGTGVVVGVDTKTDLALVKLKDPSQLPGITPLAFGDSDHVKVGDWAIAVGSPFGLRRSVTVGIVSATGRGHLGSLDTEDYIQTDAAINPGSSGGPLLNSNGEIIGLNTAIFSQTGSFIGIGFAIPSKLAKEVALQLKDHGRVIRGWLGLTAQDLDPTLAKFFKSPGTQGALITDVESKGPAGAANLQPGDVIRSYNHVAIQSADHLRGLVAKTSRGDQVPLEIIRDGNHINQTVAVREAPEAPKPRQEAGQAPGQAAPSEDPNMGLSVREVIPELAEYLSLPPRSGALVVGVQPGSPAFDSGVMPGDIVLKASGEKIKGTQDLHRILRGAHAKNVVLYIQRGDGGFFSHGSQKLFVTLEKEAG
jgi:serine protease Do